MFLVPQTVTGNEDLAGFLTSIREIEERTALDFLNIFDASIQDEIELHSNVRVS